MNKNNTPGITLSVIPIISLIILLVINVKIFGDAALDGSVQLILLTASAFVVAISIIKKTSSWADIEKGIINSIATSTSAIILLLLIGALAGSWMVSGIIPTMIYYGLKFINPTYFLLTSCITAAIISVSSGSSWTTIATVGVGLIGIGTILGFEPGWIAGAIISGAYFGDKVSPLSETTNMASSIAGVPIFKHIRFMMITTVPSFIIALIIYLVYGLNFSSQAAADTNILMSSISDNYKITPLLFIAPAITLLLIIKKFPAIIVVFISVCTGVITAIIFQQDMLINIAGTEDLTFRSGAYAIIKMLYGKISPETNNEMLNELVTTKGMSGMLNTIWLIICAMTFGGVMEASGMLKCITEKMSSVMRSTFSTVSATVASCLFLNVAAADQYIAILLPGRMFLSTYQKKGIPNQVLSRTLEDSATVTSVLVPWNTCGMAQASVLGVMTLTYLPFCFFNLISPIMTLIITAVGYKIGKSDYIETNLDYATETLNAPVND